MSVNCWNIKIKDDEKIAALVDFDLLRFKLIDFFLGGGRGRLTVFWDDRENVNLWDVYI